MRGLALVVTGAWFLQFLVACAGAPSREEAAVPAPTAPAAAPARSALSMKDAKRQAAERLQALEARRRSPVAPAGAPATPVDQRYQELLDRPGTPEERKPELLLRLAELAYREEETALREAYERGDEPDAPPGQRYVHSIAYYRRLVEGYPTSAQALTAFYNLGYLYAEEGETARSAWAYGEVLERDPGTPYADEIHMRLGEALFDAAEPAPAAQHYLAAIAGGKPEYVDKAYYKLGWCYYNLEDYQAAVDAFAEVLRRDSGSQDGLRAETLEVMAKSFLEWGGVDRVDSYLAARADLRPYGDRIYRLLGDLYFESSRYQEAAGAYGAGVDAYPASAECLTMERGIIQAYLVSRDPEAANRRRESWPARYGKESPWQARHGDGGSAAERDVMVEEGLRLAALYRHSGAQRGQGSLARALELYRQYLDWFGGDSEAGYEMAYSYAQALSEAELLEEAAAQYRAVAFHPTRDAHREDASYRRLQVLATLHEQDPARLGDRVDALRDYVALNPQSALVPEMLFAEGEILFEAERFGEARGAFAVVTRDHPGHPLAPQARERIARCYFREEAFAETENACRDALAGGLDALAEERVRKLLAFAVFKQAENAEQAGQLPTANRHFLRLADEFPAEEASQIALYRAAENLTRLGDEGGAAQVYDRLAKAYPGTQYAQNALVLSARIFVSLGDWGAAARGYEDLYRATRSEPGAADALYSAARAWERDARGNDALRLYAEFAGTFPADPRVAETRFREGELLRELGRNEDAIVRYQAAWEAANAPEADVFRARAALAIGKLRLAAFEAVPLRGDLEQALVDKETLLEESLEQLARAASLPIAETLTEALFRAGAAFEHMKAALLNSERPPDLTEEEAEEYTFLLEERAFPLEDRAVGYYRRGVGAARDAGVHTLWVDRMFGRLEELLPWAYQRGEEAVSSWEVPDLPGWVGEVGP